MNIHTGTASNPCRSPHRSWFSRGSTALCTIRFHTALACPLPVVWWYSQISSFCGSLPSAPSNQVLVLDSEKAAAYGIQALTGYAKQSLCPDTKMSKLHVHSSQQGLGSPGLTIRSQVCSLVQCVYVVPVVRSHMFRLSPHAPGYGWLAIVESWPVPRACDESGVAQSS